MTKNLALEQLSPLQRDHRDALLDAAAHLFRLRGFAATGVRDIAQAAGVRPGSLHYRFPSKDALLVELMSRAVEQVTAAVRLAVAGSRDPAERLRLGLRVHLETLLSGNDAFYVLLYDSRSLEPRARAAVDRLRHQYEGFWDGLLYEAVGAGFARDGVDVTLVRQFGFGAMNWVAQWYQPDGGRTPGQIADAFWSYLALGLVAEDRRAVLLGGKPTPLARRAARTSPAARASPAARKALPKPVGQLTKSKRGK